ncbi:MAG: extradiol ring-cleavage dioxygenase [Pseudomonadota bacterium]
MSTDHGIIASVLTPHTPRMAVADKVPEFIEPLVEGSKQLGDWIRSLQPDCVVLQTTHWVSTFNWYATSHATHEGVCIADEAPDMVPGLPYQYRGDPDFASGLIGSGEVQGIPFKNNDNPHFRWDYGTYVPLKYIDPDAELRIVTIPTVILANLEECLAVGRLVDSVAKAQGKRVVFIASTALSHALVRGPSQWPTPEEQQLDSRLTELICAGEIDQAIGWLPEYVKAATAEMGGRVVAGFFGAASALSKTQLHGRTFGEYAQSSGSGNHSIVVSIG